MHFVVSLKGFHIASQAQKHLRILLGKEKTKSWIWILKL